MLSHGQSDLTQFINAPLEIIDGDRGKSYPKQSDFFVREFCLFLNAGNVTQTGFNFSNCAFITKEKDSELRKGKLQRGDIVLTTRGTVGNVAYFDNNVPFEHIRINSGMVIIRTKPNELDPKFLYSYLRSRIFEDQVKALTTGSAQPQLPIRDIQRISLPLLPLEKQKYIADIIGNLDRKIILNNQINETLESMAKAIFKEWFIDFGPVKAKSEGKKTFGMDDETASLFPDSFEDSELGQIPKTWSVTAYLNDVAVIGGGTPKTSVVEYWNGDIPWFSIVDSPKDGDIWAIDTEKKITTDGLNSSSTKVLDVGTSIITARGTVGKIALVGTQMAMNQSCYALKCKNGFPYYYYFLLKSLVAQLRGRSHGSVFDTITTNTLSSLNYSKPSEKVLQKFDDTVSPLLSQIKNNLYENKSLGSLRDLLLPKLISGEIDLRGDLK